MIYLVSIFFLPTLIIGTVFFIVPLLTVLKERRRGVKVNFWFLMNTLWRVAHSPFTVLNQEYSEKIKKDFGDV